MIITAPMISEAFSGRNVWRIDASDWDPSAIRERIIWLGTHIRVTGYVATPIAWFDITKENEFTNRSTHPCQVVVCRRTSRQSILTDKSEL
jgi:hypothetical protein